MVHRSLCKFRIH